MSWYCSSNDDVCSSFDLDPVLRVERRPLPNHQRMDPSHYFCSLVVRCFSFSLIRRPEPQLLFLHYITVWGSWQRHDKEETAQRWAIHRQHRSSWRQSSLSWRLYPVLFLTRWIYQRLLDLIFKHAWVNTRRNIHHMKRRMPYGDRPRNVRRHPKWQWRVPSLIITLYNHHQRLNEEWETWCWAMKRRERNRVLPPQTCRAMSKWLQL